MDGRARGGLIGILTGFIVGALTLNVAAAVGP